MMRRWGARRDRHQVRVEVAEQQQDVGAEGGAEGLLEYSNAQAVVRRKRLPLTARGKYEEICISVSATKLESLLNGQRELVPNVLIFATT